MVSLSALIATTLTARIAAGPDYYRPPKQLRGQSGQIIAIDIWRGGIMASSFRQILQQDRIAFGHHQCALHGVFQFAHVAGPIVGFSSKRIGLRSSAVWGWAILGENN